MFRLRGLTKSINVFFLKLHLTWQPFYNPTEWISFSFFVHVLSRPKSEKKKKSMALCKQIIQYIVNQTELKDKKSMTQPIYSSKH